ncbi:MAG: glycosyltransferase [Selenomonadaceae bacterium]|nr:glycosyltransferase [Selenomonadaceae bacterium]
MMTQYDVPWRYDLFHGWHFYDISQSMEFRKRGYRIVVPGPYDIWCIHDSPGFPFDTDPDYNEARRLFLDTYQEFL